MFEVYRHCIGLEEKWTWFYGISCVENDGCENSGHVDLGRKEGL